MAFCFYGSNWIFGQTQSGGPVHCLEPAYCLEIEMLGVRQVQVDIRGDGLRERGLGSCSSKTSWSLPQCGHFNFLTVIG